ncbi:flagellar brake protein [Caballeronia humi]|uniref:Type IV pilus assembly protein PilZ n=1 Tax=Caballeronia humi TaxID=326474 RepID=A0A158FGM8_9BURK|nr:flagellar brake protein [Caballeronia humi]SAL18773.1 type IV pilus assembly protein PilZ [Caballeronia humi]
MTIESVIAPLLPALVRLGPDDIPLQTPLEWPIVAADGTLLFDAGVTVPNEAAREFIFRQFEPHRRRESANAGEFTEEQGKNDSAPLTLDDIGLAIGARVGLRGAVGPGSAMYASRVIGVSSGRRTGERALFVTQPVMAGFDALELVRGEQVEMVALSGRGVFRFACTVDAVAREPFNYVVLSEPGGIRRLRTRKFARMPTRLAARYSPEGGAALTQVGRVCDISPYGMSLAVVDACAQLGDRLRVSFHFNTDDVDVHIDTHAIVRHVGKPGESNQNATYGLEFEALESSHRIALKSFMAEHG